MSPLGGYSFKRLKGRIPNAPSGTADAMVYAIKSIVDRYDLHAIPRPWIFTKSPLAKYAQNTPENFLHKPIDGAKLRD